jgi:hypothetical protein
MQKRYEPVSPVILYLHRDSSTAAVADPKSHASQERKKAIKEEQREKRKTKMPKAEKKKKIKNSRGG